MSALEQPKRRELVFSASPESWARIDQVMAQQGHDKYSLTVARGFALVQWVLEQQAAGRVVGAVDGAGGDFSPLTERPELLAPARRMQIVPGPPAGATPQAAEPACAEPPAGSPLAALGRLESSVSRKDQVPPEETRPSLNYAPLRTRRKPGPPKKRTKVDTRPSGAGRNPVRSLQEARAEAKIANKPQPIEHDGKPLPWDLGHQHLASLLEEQQVPFATHFRIEGPSHMGVYANRPKKDWCLYDPVDFCWRPNEKAREGVVALYNIQLAIDYLQANPVQAPPALEAADEEVHR